MGHWLFWHLLLIPLLLLLILRNLSPGFLGPHPYPHPATYKSIDIPPFQLNNSTRNDDEISTIPRG